MPQAAAASQTGLDAKAGKVKQNDSFSDVGRNRTMHTHFRWVTTVLPWEITRCDRAMAAHKAEAMVPTKACAFPVGETTVPTWGALAQQEEASFHFWGTTLRLWRNTASQGGSHASHGGNNPSHGRNHFSMLGSHGAHGGRKPSQGEGYLPKNAGGWQPPNDKRKSKK